LSYLEAQTLKSPQSENISTHSPPPLFMIAYLSSSSSIPSHTKWVKKNNNFQKYEGSQNNNLGYIIIDKLPPVEVCEYYIIFCAQTAISTMILLGLWTGTLSTPFTPPLSPHDNRGEVGGEILVRYEPLSRDIFCLENLRMYTRYNNKLWPSAVIARYWINSVRLAQRAVYSKKTSLSCKVGGGVSSGLVRGGCWRSAVVERCFHCLWISINRRIDLPYRMLGSCLKCADFILYRSGRFSFPRK